MESDKRNLSMDDRAAVRDGYDGAAEAYAADRTASPTELALIDELLKRCPTGSRILDAGCGQGRPILTTLAEATDAVGIDLSRRQLELAREVTPATPLMQGDVAKLPLESNTVDAIVALHTVIHIPAVLQSTVIGEFARVLRPGGWLLVSDGPEPWHGLNPDWLDSGAKMHWEITGIDRTAEQLTDAGFAIETQTERVDDEHWVYVLAQLGQ